MSRIQLEIPHSHHTTINQLGEKTREQANHTFGVKVLAFYFVHERTRLASPVSQRSCSTESTWLYDKAIRHCQDIFSEWLSVSIRVTTDAGTPMIG